MMLCLYVYGDADCHIQYRNSKNDGSAGFATCFCCPAVLRAREPPSGYAPEHPISFLTTLETPTGDAFWPSGPFNEPVDTSGLFGAIGGVSGGETGGSTFMVERVPVQELGRRGRIAGGLVVMIHAVVMSAMIHYQWKRISLTRHSIK